MGNRCSFACKLFAYKYPQSANVLKFAEDGPGEPKYAKIHH